MDTAAERKTKEKIDSSYILLSQVRNKIISTNFSRQIISKYSQCNVSDFYRKNTPSTKPP